MPDTTPPILDSVSVAAPEGEDFAAQVLQAVENHPFFNRASGQETPDAAVIPATPVPVAEGEPAPVAAGETPAASGEPAPTAEVGEVGGYVYKDSNGVEHILSQEQVDGLLAVNAWADSLRDRPQITEQFGLIEQGRAVAVPTDEYAAYQAWRQSQQHAPTPDWVDELDPAARAAFDQQQQQIIQLQQSLAEQQSNQHVPVAQADLNAKARVFDDAMAVYADKHGYDDNQMGAFLQTAVSLNVIPNFIEAQRVYSPSGILLKDADLTIVAQQALDFGRLQLGVGSAASSDPTPPPVPAPSGLGSVPGTPAPTHTDTLPATPTTTVATKKARASSLAAAPSAATTPPQVDPRTLSPQGQRDLIADMLRAQGIAS